VDRTGKRSILRTKCKIIFEIRAPGGEKRPALKVGAILLPFWKNGWPRGTPVFLQRAMSNWKRYGDACWNEKSFHSEKLRGKRTLKRREEMRKN